MTLEPIHILMPCCFRCSGTLAPVASTSPEIDFYACPVCQSQYAQGPDTGLHDRWLMPLSLPLYHVIFERDPASRAIEIARQYWGRDDLDLDILEQHIAEELRHPRQKVSEILDFQHAGEHQLREFLGRFLEELKELRKHTP